MGRLVLVVIAAAIFAAPASASQLIDRNATRIKLEVGRDGKALLTYRAHGRLWRIHA